MPSPELRTAESTPRSLFMDALMSVGVSPRRAGRTAEGFLGRTERTPFGFLDLTPAGTPLAAKYSADAFQRGDIKTGLLEALGAIPFGIGKSARAPLQAGEKMETVMLRGGRYPEYGIIDKSDNTLVTAFGGRVRDSGDFSLEVANAVPNPREVDELLAHGEISPLQAEDIIQGPKIHPESGLLDALKMRGISGIGNSIRSGTATKNVRGAMDAMRAASRTKPLREAEGDFTGQRVTGSRTKARVSIPKSREKAEKHGIKPARDLTIPTPKPFKEMLRPIRHGVRSFKHRKGAPTDYQEIWDNPFQAVREEGQKILGRNRPTIRETIKDAAVPRRAASTTEDAALHSGEPLSDVIARREREERLRGLREAQTERLDIVTRNWENRVEREARRREPYGHIETPRTRMRHSREGEPNRPTIREAIVARRRGARGDAARQREARAREDVESPVINTPFDEDDIPF